MSERERVIVVEQRGSMMGTIVQAAILLVLLSVVLGGAGVCASVVGLTWLGGEVRQQVEAGEIGAP